MRLATLVCAVAISLTLLTSDTLSEEYGSFHDSVPPFHFMKENFKCDGRPATHVLWDSITVEVHSSTAPNDCGAVILRDQNPEVWSTLEKCINQEDVSERQCSNDEEYGISFQFDTDHLVTNPDIFFPCRKANRTPEILAIHILYRCGNHSIHEDDAEHGDVMTMSPMLPPMPPQQSAPSSQSPQEPDTTTSNPTSTDKTTEQTTTKQNKPPSPEETTTRQQAYHGSSDGNRENVESHALTAHELAVIVGPSVAAIALVGLLAIVVFVLYKRQQCKSPHDLQGESLFNSRRFSTASQISDISFNGTSMRAMP